jgi:hypothetical protein
MAPERGPIGYNPEATGRHHEGAGAMQRPQNLDRSDAEQKPGAVFRPGASREFQFPESTDLHGRVKRWDMAIYLA